MRYYVLSILIFIFSISAYSQSSLLTDIVAYWNFDEETSGEDAVDEVASMHGVLANAVLRIDPGTLPPINNCIQFDGINDYVVAPDVAALQMGTSNFSMSMLVYMSNLPASGDDYIIGGENGAASISINTAGELMVHVYYGYDAPACTSYPLSAGAWYRISVTFNSTATTNNLVYYVNGNSQTVTFNRDFTAGSSSMYFGGANASVYYFAGDIDELGIWKKILTAAEIDTLINGPDGTGGEGYPYPFSSASTPSPPPSHEGSNIVLASIDRSILLKKINRNILSYSTGLPPAPPSDIDYYTMYDGTCSVGASRWTDYDCIVNDMSNASVLDLKDTGDYSSDKVYIDPTYSGTESGSLSQPWNSWADFTIESNHAYLQKKGTTATITPTYLPAVSPRLAAIQILDGMDNVYLGAYGMSGARPIIIPSTYANVIHQIGDGLIVDGLDLQGVDDVTAGSNVILCRGASSGLVVYDCKISNAYNGFSSYNSGQIRIIETEVTSIFQDAIWASEYDFLEVSNCNIHNYNTAYRYWHDEDCDPPSYMDGCASGDGIQVLATGAEQQWFHDNIIDASDHGNKACIYVEAESMPSVTTIVEDNTLYSPLTDTDGDGGSAMNLNGGSYNRVFRNLFKASATQGNTNTTEGYWNGGTNDSIIGNVFADYYVAYIESYSHNAIIAHNTFYNNITAFQGGRGTFYNNLVNVPAGGGLGTTYVVAEDQNMFDGISLPSGFSNSITGTSNFVSAGTMNFHLQPPSGAINTGTSLGYYTVDKDKNSFSGNPDIGAYEYIP